MQCSRYLRRASFTYLIQYRIYVVRIECRGGGVIECGSRGDWRRPETETILWLAAKYVELVFHVPESELVHAYFWLRSRRGC